MLKTVVLLNIFVKTDMVKSLKEHLFEIVKKFRSLQNTSVTFVNLMLSCKIKVFIFFKKNIADPRILNGSMSKIYTKLWIKCVTLYFKVSLLQCNYTFKYWVILINYMYVLYVYG